MADVKEYFTCKPTDVVMAQRCKRSLDAAGDAVEIQWKAEDLALVKNNHLKPAKFRQLFGQLQRAGAQMQWKDAP